MTRYTVTIHEQASNGTHWVYSIDAASPALAAIVALGRSVGRGFPVGRATVRVYSGDIRGNTIGHEPAATYPVGHALEDMDGLYAALHDMEREAIARHDVEGTHLTQCAYLTRDPFAIGRCARLVRGEP